MTLVINALEAGTHTHTDAQTKVASKMWHAPATGQHIPGLKIYLLHG